MQCQALWKAFYIYAIVKRCVLSVLLNFSNLTSSLIVFGSEFQSFGPYMLNDLLAKVCFLMFGTISRAFLFSDLRLG